MPGLLGGGSGLFHTYFVYTANRGSNDISVFKAIEDGSLTFVKKVPCPGGPFKILMNSTTMYVACASKIQVFSIDRHTGDLTPAQSVSMDSSKGTFNPLSMSYGIKNGNFYQMAYFYALGVSEDGSKGELQAYDLQTDGSIKLRASYVGFSNPGAMTGLALDVKKTNFIAVTNTIGNSVTLMSDDGTSLATLQTLKVSSADTGLLFAVLPDSGGGIYVMDEESRSITEMRIASQSHPTLSVVKRITLNSSPTYLGTNGSKLFSASQGGGMISSFQFDSPTIKTPFSKDSTELDGGDSPTAVNGVPIQRADLDVSVLYSTTRDGRLRFYQQIGKGTPLAYLTDYDTKGSDVQDVVFSAEIGDVPPLTVTPVSVPDGVVGKAYSQPFKMTGGDTSKGFTLFDVPGGFGLPDGLTMNTKTPPAGYIGVLEGTPKKAGTYKFTIHAQRGNDERSFQYNINITGGTTPLQIATTSVKAGVVNTAYQAQIVLSGGDGTQKATWSVSSGSLPPGLALKSTASSETIAGTPTSAGSFSFTLKAVQGSQSDTQDYTLSITNGNIPTMVRVMNATTDAADNDLFMTINTTGFSHNLPGVLSVSGGFQAGTVPYRVSNGDGQRWADGNVTITDKSRNIFVALGAIAGDRQVSALVAPASFPGSTLAGILFMDGIPGRDLSAVDVALVDSTGQVVDQKTNIAFGGTASFTFPPGSYKLVVSTFGETIFSSNLQSIAAGEDYVEVAVSPENVAAKFFQVKEDH
ncbi:MAG TPA: putative Ig domain-containing protein [Fimbriimonas sp.]|nr:putative Ig domain-containing protein [Fimbriimonas sp.]